MSSKKLVILYLIDSLQTGGAEKSLLAITSRLRQFTPVFVTLFNGKHDLLPVYEQAGIKVIRLGLTVSNRFKEIAAQVDRIVEEEQAVIVHSSIFRSDMVARQLKSRVTIVNSLVNNSYRKRRYDGLSLKRKLSLMGVQLLDRLTLNKIDLMIANSKVLVDSHQKTIGLNPNRAVVIHRGREIPKTNVNRIFSKESQDRTWLVVGRLIERKGHKDLLIAFAQLLKKRPGDRLILAGDGDYRNPLLALIEKLGIADSVELLGTVPEVSELLQTADYFVFPSYFEGLPGALIEAMMARLPIICSAIPENKECLSEDMCLFHEVGNAADILEKMQAAIVLDDWEIRTAKAYAYAVEHFEIGKIVQQYEDTYLKLIASCAE